MSTMLFYQQQAAQQQTAADAATLDNVRERCQRAADAWMDLASRLERTDALRRTREGGTADAVLPEATDGEPA